MDVRQVSVHLQRATLPEDLSSWFGLGKVPDSLCMRIISFWESAGCIFVVPSLAGYDSPPTLTEAPVGVNLLNI